MTTVTAPKFSLEEAKALHAKAHDAGMAAGEAHSPTPMIVGQETHFFSGVLDTSKPTHVISGGICGHAWIEVKGNTSFGRHVKHLGYRHSDYFRCYMLSVRGFGQSMERKEAYAAAYVDVLREACVVAYVGSRMD